MQRKINEQTNHYIRTKESEANKETKGKTKLELELQILDLYHRRGTVHGNIFVLAHLH